MGLFKIRRSDSKLTLQLKGDFDTENIDWITQLLKKRRFFICKIFELDMSGVGAISSEGLSHLFSVLEILQARKTKTFITGLDPARHSVPYQAEIRATTQMATHETAIENKA